MVKICVKCLVVLLCAVMLETAILSNFTALPAVPDVVLLCALYFALRGGPTFGCALSFVSGFLLDCATGAPLGYNCLFRVVIGFAAGFVGRAIYFDGAFIPVLIGAFSVVATWAIIFVMSFLFPGVRAVAVNDAEALFYLLSTAFLAPIVFKLLSNLDGENSAR